MESHLTQLQTFIIQQRLPRAPDSSVLLWTLMTDPDTYSLSCPERVWLMSRILWVTKRLDSHFMARFHTTMLQFLFGSELNTDTGPGRDGLEEDLVVEMVRESGIVAIGDRDLDCQDGTN